MLAFVSPLFMGAVSSGIWGENTTLGQFELAFIGMLVLGIAVVVYEARIKESK